MRATPLAPAVAVLAVLASLALADDLDEARKLLGGERHEEGVARIRKCIAALRAGEPDADQLNAIGRGHFYLEEDAEALAALREAVGRAPADPEHRFWLGLVLMYSDLPAAQECLAKAVELGPKVARYSFEHGRVLTLLKKPEAALAAYLRVCELDPGNAAAHTNAGNLLSEAGRSDDARKHYEAALALDPRDLMARYNLGQLHYDAKRFAEALEQWQAACEQDPTDFGVTKKVVQALFALDRFDDAGPYRKRLIELRAGLEDKPRDFCFDQFDAGAFRVFAYERFDTRGDLVYHFVFKVTDAKGDLVRTVNLESSAVARELGVAYILGGNEPDGTHRQYGPMWKAMPKYPDLRKLVVDAADGELER